MVRLVFFGTAAIGLPILRELNKHYQPGFDRHPARPPRRPQPPAAHPSVKQFALENRLPLMQPPSTCASPELELAMIGRIEPDYRRGRGLRPVHPQGHPHSLPRCHTINVHFSLLPAYRGAAPVQRAIENGETRSGITIFEISGRMDAGPVWAREESPSAPTTPAPPTSSAWANGPLRSCCQTLESDLRRHDPASIPRTIPWPPWPRR